MKQNLLNKLWLRVWMIVAIMTTALAGTAWADDATSTLTFSAKCNGSGTADDGAAWTVTSDGTESTFDNTKGIHYGTSSAQVQYIQLSTSDISGTITKVVVNASAASGVSASVSVNVGGSAFGGEAQSVTTSAANYTFEGSASGEIVVKLEKPSRAAKALYVKSIAVTYTTGGGDTPSLDDCDLALTGAPIALSFDLYNNSSAQVVNYTTSSTGAVTIADNDYATFDIDEDNMTITVTPTAVTPSAQTITVSQEADDEYKAGSATFTVTITDSTPVPTHTATFSVNGVTSTQDFEEGAAITFPGNIADVSGKTFVGWVTEVIDGTTTDAPTFVTSATMGEADITYYAVFAYANGSSSEVTDVLNRALTDVTGTNYTPWSGKTATSDAVYAGNSAGGNESIQLRTSSYSGIVTTTSGGKVKKVTITWNSNTSDARVLQIYGKNSAYEAVSDLFTNGSQGTLIEEVGYGTEEVTVIDDYEYIGIRSKSGALYLEEVQITWSTGSVTYSGYCTTVVAAAVARPVIEVAANPFLFSTTATITCETEGAAIKYSFDGENWNDYTEALTITATTTVYAKAVKDETESEVASVTITKNLAVPAVAIDDTGITNTNVYDGTEAGSLAASVSYNDAAVEGATVTWSGNNDEVATIDAATGAVTLVGAGTVTFTATYAGNEDYAEKTATYEMTVTNSDPNAPGTENNPYTVAEAIAATPASGTSANVYIKGVVSGFFKADIMSDGSNYRYYISDDGTTDNQLLVYKGKGLNNEAFSSADDLLVGDEVVILGSLTTYSNAPEVASGNYIVSLDRPVVTTPSIELGDNEINAFAEGTDGVIIVDYKNITNVVAEVFFCDADGNATTYDWVEAEINEIGNLVYIIDANESTEARTAYMKVYALDDNAEDVYSELITINQAGFVAPPTPGEWVETALADLTFADVFVIVGNNGSTYALSNDNGTSKAPDAVEVEVVDNTLSGEIADNIKWTISGNATDGYVFYPNGDTKTWLYCTNTNNGVRVGTNTTNNEFTVDGGYLCNAATSRYVGIYNSLDWRCYTNTTGNIAGQTFKFYKKLTTSQTVTVSAAGYATLVAAQDLEIPAGVEVYAVEVKGNYALLNQVTAGIPAGEAVVVKADEGEYVFNYATEAVSELDVTNDLIAATAPVTADGTQYVLAKPGEEVGFYKAKEGTTIAAGKAYLEITGEAPVKGFTFIFGDEADGVSEIENGKLKVENEGAIYNLAGQRVSKMQRGVNIVNGKKILR